MKRRLLLKIVSIAFYLISFSSLGNASDEANAKRQRFIEEAENFCFKSKGWKIEETDYFIIFSHDSVSSLKEKLEKNFGQFCSQVTRRIGYKDFQLYGAKGGDWDKKFKFFVYGNQESWRQAKQKFGISEWAIAWASGNRTIFCYHLNVDKKTILHEVAHEIYKEYIKYRSIPLWWNEGIARLSELLNSEIKNKIMEARFRVINNTHTPLSQMTTYNIKEHNLIYDQGLSVVVFLLSEYGVSSFDALNKAMQDGEDFESALAITYGDHFASVNELNSAWENALRDAKAWDAILKNLSTILAE